MAFFRFKKTSQTGALLFCSHTTKMHRKEHRKEQPIVHRLLPAKRDIGYPGKNGRIRALIADTADKFDYQLGALSQKVS